MADVPAQQKKSGLPIPRGTLSLGWSDLLWAISNIKEAQADEIEKFERKFAEHLRAREAIYLQSAPAALYLILLSLELPRHSKVLVPAWIDDNLIGAIIAADLEPYLVDVRRGSWVVGPEKIMDDDWKNVSAILVSHMGGCPAPIDELEAIARSKKVAVLEDCSQGWGATVRQRPVGSYGDAAVFSLDLFNNFTTLGGGMAVFNNEELAEKARQRLTKLESVSNDSVYTALLSAATTWIATTRLGFTLTYYPCISLGWAFGANSLHVNFLIDHPKPQTTPIEFLRPAPIQAALGRRIMEWANDQNQKRTRLGRRLLKLLQEAQIPNLGLPEDIDYGDPVFTSFTVTCEAPEKMARQMSSNTIDTSPGFLRPIHQIPSFSDHIHYRGTLPNATLLGKSQLYLPLYPSLKERDLERIVQACQDSVEFLLAKGSSSRQPTIRFTPTPPPVAELSPPSSEAQPLVPEPPAPVEAEEPGFLVPKEPPKTPQPNPNLQLKLDKAPPPPPEPAPAPAPPPAKEERGEGAPPEREGGARPIFTRSTSRLGAAGSAHHPPRHSSAETELPPSPGAPPRPGAPARPGMPPHPGMPPRAGLPPQPGAPGRTGLPPQPGAPPRAGMPPRPGMPPRAGLPPQPGAPPPAPEGPKRPQAPSMPPGAQLTNPPPPAGLRPNSPRPATRPALPLRGAGMAGRAPHRPELPLEGAPEAESHPAPSDNP